MWTDRIRYSLHFQIAVVVDFLSYGLTIRIIHFLKKKYHIICFVNKEN
jgi:hypothetical protein